MSAADLLEQGRQLLDAGAGNEAMACFRQALEQGESAEGWLLLAEAQIEAGLTGQAHVSIASGLNLDGDAVDLHYLLGDLYLAENKNAEALATYRKIIELEPREADAWVSLAMAYVNVDDLDAAAECGNKALEIDPESTFALSALGDIHAALGAADQAIRYLEQALALEPDNPQPYFSLADIYYDKDDLPQAEKLCLQGLELDPGTASGYLLLGHICLDQDRIQESVDNYRQFLRLETSPAAKQIRDEVAAVIEGLR